MARKKSNKKSKKSITKSAKTAATPTGALITGKFAIPLTSDDRLKLGKEMAMKSIEAEDVSLKKKEINKKYQDQINGLHGEVGEMSKAIIEGKRTRNVQVTMVKDYKRDVIEYWFKDQVIQTKKMTEADRQQELAVTEAKLKKEVKAKKSASAKKRAKKDTKIALPEEDEVSNVRKLETSRKTKKSALDQNMSI